MSQLVLALYKHGDTSFVRPLYDNNNFDDIQGYALNRWPNLTIDEIYISYFLPGHPRCDLSSDDDYQNMLSMIGIYKMKTVEIFVCKRGRGDIISGSSHVSISENRLPSIEASFCDSISSDGEDFTNHDELEEQGNTLSSESWKSLIQGVNQEFLGGVKEFRNSLIRYSVYHGFEFKYLKNENSCNSRYSSSIFYIRTLELNHSCVGGFMIRKSKRMNSNIIAEEVSKKIRTSPLCRPSDICSEFPKTHGCDISYHVAYNAVEKAKTTLFGDYYLSYEETRLYIEVACKSNPGSHLLIDVDLASNRFKRMFASYNASILGYNHCHPMLFLDGTFLNGKFRGQMLCATAKDVNNDLFLLAFSIVDAENIENWTWFMQQIKFILNPNREITFISDRHKGLIEAVSRVFPSSPHGYCTIHLKNNLRSCMSGKLANFKEGVFEIIFLIVTPLFLMKSLG